MVYDPLLQQPRRGPSSAIVVQSVAKTALAADVPDTPLQGTAFVGVYRVTVYVLVTNGDGAAGTITVHVKYTDATTARDITVGPVALTVTGNFATATVIASTVDATGITYGVTHTGVFGTATYALNVVAERVT